MEVLGVPADGQYAILVEPCPRKLTKSPCPSRYLRGFSNVGYRCLGFSLYHIVVWLIHRTKDHTAEEFYRSSLGAHILLVEGGMKTYAV